MVLKSLALAGVLGFLGVGTQAATVASVGTFAGGTDFISSGGGALVAISDAPYVPNSATSAWVWDEDVSLSPVTFTYSFDLTDFAVASASLSGLWGVDNLGSAFLNGTEISSIPFGFDAFETLTVLSATTGFLSGVNTLAFVVENTGDFSAINPAAFRAEVTVTAAPVPLPATALLLLTALGGAAAARRMGSRR